MRTLSVTVTVSPLVTGDPSTCIDTESTGGLAALGMQLKENKVPVVRRMGLRAGPGSSGGSIGSRQRVCILHACTHTVIYTCIKCNCENILRRKLTLHIQSEVGCSPPCLIIAHHLIHSTVTPGSAGDGDAADRGGYLSIITGDDLAIPGPGEVGGSWSSIKPKGVSEVYSFQHSGRLVGEEAVCRRDCILERY